MTWCYNLQLTSIRRYITQVSDASRRLLEEEEICQSLSNATRKMEADAKKIKEETAMKEEK